MPTGNRPTSRTSALPASFAVPCVRCVSFSVLRARQRLSSALIVLRIASTCTQDTVVAAQFRLWSASLRRPGSQLTPPRAQVDWIRRMASLSAPSCSRTRRGAPRARRERAHMSWRARQLGGSLALGSLRVLIRQREALISGAIAACAPKRLQCTGHATYSGRGDDRAARCDY